MGQVIHLQPSVFLHFRNGIPYIAQLSGKLDNGTVLYGIVPICNHTKVSAIGVGNIAFTEYLMAFPSPLESRMTSVYISSVIIPGVVANVLR